MGWNETIPPLTNGQLIIMLVVTLGAGAGIVVLIAYFIGRNKKERKPKPLLMTLLNRYGDMLYDGRFAELTNREFSNQLRDAAMILLWLVMEAVIRLNKKMPKENISVKEPKLPPT